MAVSALTTAGMARWIHEWIDRRVHVQFEVQCIELSFSRTELYLE